MCSRSISGCFSTCSCSTRQSDQWLGASSRQRSNYWTSAPIILASLERWLCRCSTEHYQQDWNCKQRYGHQLTVDYDWLTVCSHRDWISFWMPSTGHCGTCGRQIMASQTGYYRIHTPSRNSAWKAILRRSVGKSLYVVVRRYRVQYTRGCNRESQEADRSLWCWMGQVYDSTQGNGYGCTPKLSFQDDNCTSNYGEFVPTLRQRWWLTHC